MKYSIAKIAMMSLTQQTAARTDYQVGIRVIVSASIGVGAKKSQSWKL